MQSTTSEYASALVWDAERRQIYTSQANNGLLRRYSFNTGSLTWSGDSLPVSNIVNVGLSNDGADLLVVSADSNTNTGILRMLDPLSLSFAQRASFTRSGYLTGYGPVAVTNDGRMWFAFGTSRLGYFDPVDSTFQLAPLAPTHFVSTPTFALSRDGQRMVINTSQSTSPAPPPFSCTWRLQSVSRSTSVHRMMKRSGTRLPSAWSSRSGCRRG